MGSDKSYATTAIRQKTRNTRLFGNEPQSCAPPGAGHNMAQHLGTPATISVSRASALYDRALPAAQS